MVNIPAGCSIHPTITDHLSRLGFTSVAERIHFLNPKLSDLPSPFLMKDMDRATQLILEAIREGADITIWGDYDVDGITGTALLYHFFKQYNLNATCHIPDRLTEGYGLNVETIKKIASRTAGCKVLITVDCGISNQEEILVAQNLGFTVIITDHHTPPQPALKADAVLNPKQGGCTFPFKELSGVGVAFYLAAAMRSTARNNKHIVSATCEPNMKSFMDFVALGTVADLVTLTGVNRILAKAGLERLGHSNFDGIKFLLEELSVAKNGLSAETISFMIAPVINAAGRMGEPRTALNTLIGNGEKAIASAKRLVSLNKRRRKVGNEDFEKADRLCQSNFRDGANAIVLRGEFHDGVVGITASRLVEKYRVPAFVCCADIKEGILKGSARAPENFNLYKVIEACSRFLLKFGGHKVAAGFSLEEKYFNEFERAINNSAALEKLNMTHDISMLEKNILKLDISEALNPALMNNITQLEPLGEGNPKPLFSDEVTFVSLKHFGKNQEHVRGMIRGKYKNIPCIGFNVGNKIKRTMEKRSYRVNYTHMMDTYNNNAQWKIRIENIYQ